MTTIYKYDFRVADEVTLSIPGFCYLCKIGKQNSELGILTLWCAVMPDVQDSATICLKVYGTGHPIPEEITGQNYIDTVFDGQFVWHIFRIWK